MRSASALAVRNVISVLRPISPGRKLGILPESLKCIEVAFHSTAFAGKWIESKAG
jgi:hypothetical protein